MGLWTVIIRLRRGASCTPRKPSSRDGRGDKSQRPRSPNTRATRTWEGHKTQAQPSLCLCGIPQYLNLSSLDLESACNPGPASDSSRQNNLEPEQCRLGKHTRCEWGQIQCGQDTGSTRQSYLFSVLLPPHSTTEQVSLKKVITTTPLVSGQKLDTEETSKQKKLK